MLGRLERSTSRCLTPIALPRAPVANSTLCSSHIEVGGHLLNRRLSPVDDHLYAAISLVLLTAPIGLVQE